MNNIGKVLREIRESKELSQVQVAKSLRMSQGQVSRVESGLYDTEVSTMEKFARLYKMPLSIIIWKATEAKDVPKSKLHAFTKLKPLVDKLIGEMFPKS